jgi:hypothetical protein
MKSDVARFHAGDVPRAIAPDALIGDIDGDGKPPQPTSIRKTAQLNAQRNENTKLTMIAFPSER